MPRTTLLFLPLFAVSCGGESSSNNNVTTNDASTQDVVGNDTIVAEGSLPEGSTPDVTEPDTAVSLDDYFPTRCPTEACAAPTAVSTLEALRTLLLAEPQGARYPGASCFPVSEDVAIQGTITISINDLQLPKDGGEDCTVTHFATNGLTGVTCSTADASAGCTAATLADTTVRFRRYNTSGPPIWGCTVVVEVLPPCAQPCQAGEIACEANHTCWPSAKEQCSYCLAGSQQRCSCWNGTGFLSDGTSCAYPQGDTMCSGKCQAGECKGACSH